MIFLFVLNLILAALISGSPDNQKCLKTVSNTKLLCFYSEITTLKGCKCTHVIVPSTLQSKIINKLKESNHEVKIFVTITELNQPTISLIKSSNPHGLNFNLNSFEKITSPNDILDVITTLRAKLNEKLEIIVTVPSKIDVLARFYDFKRLKKLGIEAFVLQSDFLTDSKAVTFHPSRLSGLFDVQNTDSLVDLVTNLGLSESKLIISIPVQGYHFKLKNETETSRGSPAIEVKSINRDEMCKKIGEFSDWKEGRDQDLTGVYIYRKTDWISFEDSISIDIKAKYARIRGLYGLALKDLSQDLSPNLNCQNQTSILDATYRSLSKQPRAPRGAILQSLKREIVYKENDLNFEVNNNLPCPHQGYFVNPEDCNRFYRCVQFYQPTKNNPTSKNSFTIFQFSCPSGLTFDERYEVCTWPLNLENTTRCHGSSEIAPKKQFNCPSEVGFYADLSDCRWFYACLDHGLDDHLTAYEFRCPFGLVFDEEKLMCEWPWMVARCSFESTSINIDVYGGNSKESIGIYGGLNTYDGLGVLKSVKLVEFDDQSKNVGNLYQNNLNLNQNYGSNIKNDGFEVNLGQKFDQNGKINLNSNIGQFGVNSGTYGVNFDKNVNGNVQNYGSNIKSDGFGVNFGQKVDQNGRINLAGNLNSNLGKFEVNFDKNEHVNVQNYGSNIKTDGFGVNFGQKVDQNEKNSNIGQFEVNSGAFGVNFDKNEHGNVQNYGSNIKTDGFEVNFGQKVDQNEKINLNSNIGQFEVNSGAFGVNFDKNEDRNVQNYGSNIKTDDFGVNFGQKVDQNEKNSNIGQFEVNSGSFGVNFDKNENRNVQNYGSNIKTDDFGQKVDQNERINLAGNLNTNIAQFEVNSGAFGVNFDKNEHGNVQNYGSNIKSDGFGVNFGQKVDQNEKNSNIGQFEVNSGTFGVNFDKNEHGNVQNYGSNIKSDGFGVNFGQKVDQNEKNSNIGQFEVNSGAFGVNFDKNEDRNVQNYGSNIKTDRFGVNFDQKVDQNEKNLNIGQFEVNSGSFGINFDKNEDRNVQNYGSNIKTDGFGVNFGQKVDQNEKNLNIGQFEVNSGTLEVNFDKNEDRNVQNYGSNIKTDGFGVNFGQKVDQNERINLAGNLNTNIAQFEVNSGDFGVNFDKNEHGNVQNYGSNIKTDGFEVNFAQKVDQNKKIDLNSNIGEFEVNSGTFGVNFDKNDDRNVQNYGSNIKTDGFGVNFGQKVDQNEKNSNIGQFEVNSGAFEVNFDKNEDRNVQNYGSNIKTDGFGVNFDQKVDQNGRINLAGNLNTNVNQFEVNSGTFGVNFDKNEGRNVQNYGSNIKTDVFGVNFGQKVDQNGRINLAGNLNSNINQFKVNSNGFEVNFGQSNSDKNLNQNDLAGNLNIDKTDQSFILDTQEIPSPNKNLLDIRYGKTFEGINQNQGNFYSSHPNLVPNSNRNVFEPNSGEKSQSFNNFGFFNGGFSNGFNARKTVDIIGGGFSAVKTYKNEPILTNLEGIPQNPPIQSIHPIIPTVKTVHLPEKVDLNRGGVIANIPQLQINVDSPQNDHREGYFYEKPKIKFEEGEKVLDKNKADYERIQGTLQQIELNHDFGQKLVHFDQVQSNIEENSDQNVKIDHSNLNLDQTFVQNRPAHINVDHGQNFDQVEDQNVKIDQSNLNLGQGGVNVEEYKQNRPKLVHVYTNVDHGQRFDGVKSSFEDQNVKIDQSNLNLGQGVVNVEDYNENRPKFVQIHTNLDHGQLFDQVKSNFEDQNVKIDQSNLNLGQGVVNVEEYNQNRPKLVQVYSNVDHGQRFDQVKSNFEDQNVKIDHSNLNLGQGVVNVEDYNENRPKFVQVHTNVDHGQRFDQVKSNFEDQNVKIDHSNLNLGQGVVNVEEYNQNRPKFVQVHTNVNHGERFDQVKSNFEDQNVKIDHSNLNLGQGVVNVEEYNQNRPKFVQIHTNVDHGQRFDEIKSNFEDQNVKIDHSNLNLGQGVVNVEEYNQNRPKFVQVHTNVNHGERFDQVKSNFEDQNVKIDHSNLNLGQGVVNVEEYNQNRPKFVQIHTNLDHGERFDQVKSNFEDQNVNIDHSNLNLGQGVVNVKEYNQNRPKLVQVHTNLDHGQRFDQVKSNFEDQNVKIDQSNLNLGQGVVNVEEYNQNRPKLVRVHTNVDHGQRFDEIKSNFEDQNVKIDQSNLNLGQGVVNVEDYNENQPKFVQIHTNVDHGQRFDQVKSNFEDQNVKIDHSNLNLGQGGVNVEEYNQNRPKFVQIHTNLDHGQRFDQVKSNFEDQNVNIDHSNLNLGQTIVDVEANYQNPPKTVEIHSNLGQDQYLDQGQSNFEQNSNQNVKIAHATSHSNLNLGQTTFNVEDRPQFVRVQSNLDHGQHFEQDQSNIDDKNVKIDHSNLNLGQTIKVNDQNQPKAVEIHSNLDQGQYLEQGQSNYEQNSNQNFKIDHSNLNLGQIISNIEEFDQKISNIGQSRPSNQDFDYNSNQNVKIKDDFGQITSNVDEFHQNSNQDVKIDEYLGYESSFGQKLNQNVKIDANSNVNFDKNKEGGQIYSNVDQYFNLEPVKEVPFVKTTAYQTGNTDQLSFEQKLNKNIKIDTNSKLNVGQVYQNQKVVDQNRVVITEKPFYHQINPILVEKPSILISSTPKLHYLQPVTQIPFVTTTIYQIGNKNIKIESNYDQTKSKLNQIQLNLDDESEKSLILIKNEPSQDYLPIKVVKIKEKVKDCPDEIELNQENQKVVKTTSKPNRIDFYNKNNEEVNQYLIETSKNNQRGNKKVIEFYEIDQEKLKNQDKFIEIDENKEQNQGNRRKVTKITKINKTNPQTNSMSSTNDFNPILTLKLGAQCTCVSNPIIIKSKPNKNDRINLESDQLDLNKINLNRNNHRKRPNLNQNDTSNVKNDKFEVTSARSKMVRQKLNQKLIDDDQKVIQKPFNRYGPGGLRSNEETLQGIDCKRPGLFRHPTECSKFCSCVFDSKKKRFKLYIFDCPVHLTFDQTLSACNWPGKGPACVKNTLITVD
ncbi:putative uncharacterized protein DDB_G0282133 [Onthophagus taurus]|uniref:putative uncharacterized protein DDB_G0282133 n=1 Tax=Onthophagus taurus TaxID=166361 RepID=UPI0039BDE776